MTLPPTVLDLIRRFDDNAAEYRGEAPQYHSPAYNETETRREFIDPLFKALGWDVDKTRICAETAPKNNLRQYTREEIVNGDNEDTGVVLQFKQMMIAGNDIIGSSNQRAVKEDVVIWISHYKRCAVRQ